MSAPRVAIVIVTRNSADCLATCLETTLGADYQPVRVVVVDNASTDGTRDLIELRFPSIELLTLTSNSGFAAANNVGLSWIAGTSDYAFLVNPDTRMPPTLVRGLVSLMERFPDIGAIGPLQYEYEPTGPYCTGSPNAWSRYMLQRLGAHEFVDQLAELPRYGNPTTDGDGLAEVAFIQGAALFLRLRTLAHTGVFDESFFCFYEEVDLCRRIRWAGYRVCLAVGLGIEHIGGASTKEDALRLRLMMRNRYYYALTDPRLHRRILPTLLFRFVTEDLGVRRNRRWARFLAFGLSCGWLLTKVSKVLAKRTTCQIPESERQRGETSS